MNLESLISRIVTDAQNANETNLKMVAAATLAHWIGEIEERDAKLTGEELRRAVINGLHCKEATARDYDTLGRKLTKKLAGRRAAILAADTESEALILVRAEITVICAGAQLPPAVNSLKTVLAGAKKPKAQKSDFEKAMAALGKVETANAKERKAIVDAAISIVGVNAMVELVNAAKGEAAAAEAAAEVKAKADAEAAAEADRLREQVIAELSQAA